MGCARAGFRVKDGLFSWIIAVAMCMCMFIEGGICQSAGLFFLVFLEAFNEDRGYTALITSINYGVLCLIGQ